MSAAQLSIRSEAALRSTLARLALAAMIGAGTVASLSATWTLLHREGLAAPLAAAAPGAAMGESARAAASGVRAAGARTPGQVGRSGNPVSGG